MTETLLQEDLIPESIDPNKNYLKELVGENQKFKSVEDLARGKYESDLYIKTLERKADELRADYLKAREENMAKAKLEELIDKLQHPKQQSTSSYEPPANEDKMPVFDPNQMDSLISSKIQEYEFSKRQTENFNQVKNKLRERYGNNYQSVLKEQIDNLGLTEEDVNSLARKSPNAFFRTMGLDQVQTDPFQSPPRSSIRSDNFKPTVQKRTWSYYQNMKRENPKLYSDPKTTVQMHNDAIELGETFRDGDYYAH